MDSLSDDEFQDRLNQVRAISHREDFEEGLFGLYENGTTAQREQLRKLKISEQLVPTMPWKNPSDYFRGDLSRQQKLRRILISLSLSGLSNDVREDLRGLAYCYHNAAFVGFQPEALFEEVAEMSGVEVAKFLRDFLGRAPNNRSLEAFGLRIENTAEGTEAQERGRFV